MMLGCLFSASSNKRRSLRSASPLYLLTIGAETTEKAYRSWTLRRRRGSARTAAVLPVPGGPCRGRRAPRPHQDSQTFPDHVQRQEGHLFQRLDVLLHAREGFPTLGIDGRPEPASDDDSRDLALILLQSSRFPKLERFVVVRDGARALLPLGGNRTPASMTAR